MSRPIDILNSAFYSTTGIEMKRLKRAVIFLCSLLSIVIFIDVKVSSEKIPNKPAGADGRLPLHTVGLYII